MPFYTEKWPKNGPFQHCWGILFSYFIPPEVPFGMPKAGTLRNCEIYSINSDFTGFSPFIVAIMKKLKNVIQDFTIYLFTRPLRCYKDFADFLVNRNYL